MVEHRDIYLRAHTTRHIQKRREHRRRAGPSVPKWPELALIFDTETRRFAFYRMEAIRETMSR